MTTTKFMKCHEIYVKNAAALETLGGKMTFG